MNAKIWIYGIIRIFLSQQQLNTHITHLLVTVVICLKICTFAVATTTFAKTLSLSLRCDLLENLYLCGSNNNLDIYNSLNYK